MILFLTTFIVLMLVIVLMSLPLLLGRRSEIQRGCGRECECENRVMSHEVSER